MTAIEQEAWLGERVGSWLQVIWVVGSMAATVGLILAFMGGVTLSFGASSPGEPMCTTIDGNELYCDEGYWPDQVSARERLLKIGLGLLAGLPVAIGLSVLLGLIRARIGAAAERERQSQQISTF